MPVGGNAECKLQVTFTRPPEAAAAGGTGGAGKVQNSVLESSTVDIAKEFTNMITTQRAFSASAKILSTADEMLDELVRVKR